MPVYEFYCPDCHMIFNFFSRRINTEKRPDCPKCGRPKIERQVSIFSVSKGLKEEDDTGMPDLDESRMEKTMMALASETEGIDEEDPRQVARLMKKFFNATGMNMPSAMKEAISRMEAGEDPEKIEEEMGDILGDDAGDELFSEMLGKTGLKGLRKRYIRPQVDETLYEL